jgi:PRC-barrel domain
MITENRETGSLIGSDKVEGTAVYGANDTKIGSIERVMIDKMSGRVSYAVLSFGGFLGIGDDQSTHSQQSEARSSPCAMVEAQAFVMCAGIGAWDSALGIWSQ